MDWNLFSARAGDNKIMVYPWICTSCSLVTSSFSGLLDAGSGGGKNHLWWTINPALQCHECRLHANTKTKHNSAIQDIGTIFYTIVPIVELMPQTTHHIIITCVYVWVISKLMFNHYYQANTVTNTVPLPIQSTC